MTKQKKAIWAIGVLIGVPVAMYLIGLALPKRYTAEMRLLVDETVEHQSYLPNPLQSTIDQVDAARPRSTQTQLDILTGSEVLQSALEKGSHNLPNKIQWDQANANQQYENLVRRVAVDNELNSDILTVRVTQNDPEVAAELANDIGLSYSDYIGTLAKRSGADVLRTLDTQITASKSKLAIADKQIALLKAKSNIYDVMQSGQAEAGTKSANDQKLAQLEGEYKGQVAALAVAKAELQKMHPTLISDSRNSANPLVLNLTQEIANQRTAYVDERAQYFDDFPLVKRQLAQIHELERQLREAKAEIPAENDTSPNPVYQNQLETVQSLSSQVQSLQLQVDALRAASEHSAAILASIPMAEEQLQGLIRDRTIAEQNYESLEQMRSNIEASGGYARRPSAKIVSTALPPSVPSFPDNRLLLMGGFALGAFFAILILMPRPQAHADDASGIAAYGSISGDAGYSPLIAGGTQDAQTLHPEPRRGPSDADSGDPTNGA